MAQMEKKAAWITLLLSDAYAIQANTLHAMVSALIIRV